MHISLSRNLAATKNDTATSHVFMRMFLRLALTYVLVVLIVLFVHPYLKASRPQPSPPATNVVTQIDPAPEEEERIFNDTAWVYDFGSLPDGALSSTDWNFENGTNVANYNNEAQAYTSRQENVRIEDGLLVIQAQPEKLHGKQYTSARINTLGAFDFTYGTLEIEMQLPSGKGTWPAAWLMPANERYKPSDYGIQPTDNYGWVLNGEIDFVEAIGSIPGENIPAAHSYNQMRKPTLYTPGTVRDPYTKFHTYGIRKSPGKIEFMIDGTVFATREKTSNSPLDWPFEQSYYLIINLALGGSWAGAEGIDDTSAPWQMKIKSISYTALKQ